MSNRFENPDEAHAWSTFFAAQCPRVSSVPAKNIQKEIDAAAACADEMLHAWRERAYAEDDEEPTEENTAPNA
jgi:hypothetical protein